LVGIGIGLPTVSSFPCASSSRPLAAASAACESDILLTNCVVIFSISASDKSTPLYKMLQGLAAQQGRQRFTGGQGFSSWGQGQGLRFPGQGSVVGDSRTILNLINPTNREQAGLMTFF
jgi:hypothetical protein